MSIFNNSYKNKKLSACNSNKAYKNQFFYSYIQIIAIIKSEIDVISWVYSNWSI